MICGSSLRNVIIQAGSIGGLSRGSLWLGIVSRVLHDNQCPFYPWNCELRRFRASVKMMVDTCGMGGQSSIVDVLPGKEEGGGYVSGGCKSDEDMGRKVHLSGVRNQHNTFFFYMLEDGKISCGYSSFRGKRASMEDFFDIKISKMNGQTVCLFGIFDGHGGSRAAEYLKQHLFDSLIKHPQFMEDTKVAISETYKQTDKDFLDAEKDTFRDDGSTASTAVLVGNRLYVANVGDSRTIISMAGKAIPLSEDHKPNRHDERKRIESAGGVVMWAGTWRVGGVLAMSRAFGNRMLKQFVVAEPEIQEQVINKELELLVLASDGLWDVVPNEDAISIAWAEGEPDAAAGKLTETAFTRGSADNITCIVVKFDHDKADGPQLEPQKEPMLQQDQIKESTFNQEQCKVHELHEDQIKSPEQQHDQMKEVDLQEDQTEETETGPELVKEATIQQEHNKEAQPRHELEVPLDHFSGGGSLASA